MVRTTAAAIALALWWTPATAAAWCRTRSERQPPSQIVCATGGVAVAWQGTCVSVHVNPAVTAPGIPRDLLRTVVEEGASAWNGLRCDGAASTFQLWVGEDVTDPVEFTAGQPARNVITWRSTWGDDRDHDPRAAAITTTFFSARSGAILDADVELNVHALTPFSADGGPGTTDLRTVVLHELGHVLGLAHSEQRTAVMYFEAGQGERRRVLTADDVAGLCTIYPPWRQARCDPELRTEALEGGGLTCASGPRHSDRGAPLAVGVLVALWHRRRRPTR